MTRVYAISDATEAADPDYLEGLRTALTAGLDYALTAVEVGEERVPAIPTALFAQARLAVRTRVSLDTVLRRYLAAYSLFTEFVIQEGEDGDFLHGASLQSTLRGQASLFDRLIDAVSEEYRRESSSRLSSTEQRRAERVKQLLAGQIIDTAGLEYDFDGHHVGAVAAGPCAVEVIQALAKALDHRLLFVRPGEEEVWSWLGARHRIDPNRVKHQTSETCLPQGVSLAIGEPSEGILGWRLTHRQARAAFAIALRNPEHLIRYGDVTLLASVLQDDLLATSLRELYLVPLAQERDGGATARETLRAYFLAEGNISSAALALGVNRQTVKNRLHMIEQRLGRLIHTCTPELDAALRLYDLTDAAAGY